MLKHTQWNQPDDKNFINSPIISEIYKLSYLIKLHLDPGEPKHTELVEHLNHIEGAIDTFILNDDSAREDDLEKMYWAIKKIDLSCQQLLKKEWEKVQKEAESLYK